MIGRCCFWGDDILQPLGMCFFNLFFFFFPPRFFPEDLHRALRSLLLQFPVHVHVQGLDRVGGVGEEVSERESGLLVVGCLRGGVVLEEGIVHLHLSGLWIEKYKVNRDFP